MPPSAAAPRITPTSVPPAVEVLRDEGDEDHVEGPERHVDDALHGEHRAELWRGAHDEQPGADRRISLLPVTIDVLRRSADGLAPDQPGAHTADEERHHVGDDDGGEPAGRDGDAAEWRPDETRQ